jgi:hypothetical protein
MQSSERSAPATREGFALLGWWSASVVVGILHNGLWATPNLAFWSLIAENPGTNPFTAAMPGDYLLTNLSLTTLASVTDQTALHAYARLHLVVLVLGWAAVVALAWRNQGYKVARNLSVVLAAAPLVTVSMQWLGQPDPLTGMCGVAMVLVRRRWAVVALAVLAGLTHPEQALFMAMAAAVVRPLIPQSIPQSADDAESGDAGEPQRWWPAAGFDAMAALGGVVIGRALTQIVFVLTDTVVRNPRTDYLRFGLDGFWEHHTRQPLGLLWTLWGPLWLVVAAIALGLWIRRDDPEVHEVTRLAGVAAAVAVAALAPVLVTLDETRVYAVVSAPLLVVVAILVARLLPDRVGRWATAGLLVLTLVIPGGFATGVTSWRGRLGTSDMVLFLVDGTLPETAGTDTTTWLLEPFDFVIPDLPDS